MDALNSAGPERFLQLILNHRRVRALVACGRGVVVRKWTASICGWVGVFRHSCLLPLHVLPSLPSIPLTFNNDAVDAQGRVGAHHPDHQAQQQQLQQVLAQLLLIMEWWLGVV